MLEPMPTRALPIDQALERAIDAARARRPAEAEQLAAQVLEADPNHVRTWQYYGLWQLEQGNREQAEYHLRKIAELAGKDSADYKSLAAALEQPPGTALVY